ncbi:MAG: hypothetical protein GEU80_04030 [Dehalococcoidia bacterium]|nr:hypothetical protein [Dehalococcoidia bacterium]
MDCPNCGAVLRERDRAGVKIDFCADCKGVWLDRGELDKIIQIELSDAEDDFAPVSRDRREYRDRDDDDNRRRGYREGRDSTPKKSKKKSFFESLTEMAGGGEAED